MSARAATREPREPRRVDDLVDWLRDYGETRINSRLIDERRTIPPHVVLDFGNQGLLGMEVPARYGGLELSARDSMRVLVQLGAIDLTLALFVGNNNALGVRPILRYGSEDLREELLPLLGSGRELAAFALTEAAAGSNPRAIEATGLPDGAKGWTLRGTKLFIGSASWAGVINVFVQLAEADGTPRGITGFAVRQGVRGLRQGSEALTMGMRGMVQNAVELDGVHVGPRSLLGREGAGLEVTQDAMQVGRLGLGATSIGGMKRCAQLMHRYAQRRQIASGRLLDNPVSLDQLGGVIAGVSAIETLVDRAATVIDEGGALPAEVLMACKTAGTEHLWVAADSLVQLLGGRGYVESNGAARLLRDARVFRIFEGPTETLRMFMGASVIHESPELDRFLRSVLRVSDVADRLRDAVSAIRERSGRDVPSADPGSAYRWACAHAGAVAEAALLVATTQADLAGQASGERRRALAWAEARFEQAVAGALAPAAGRGSAFDADEISAAVSRYEDEIGDVEQTFADEDRELDALLRRTPRPSSAAPEARSPHLRLERERAPLRPDAPTPTAAELAAWMSTWLAGRLGLPKERVDHRAPLASFGLDSVLAVELAGELGRRLGVPVDATLAWEYPTIAALAGYLARQGATP
jgi:alkylation response protein AidB-like acyl-CoA dehydrogenase/acyl carrier protein